MTKFISHSPLANLDRLLSYSWLFPQIDALLHHGGAGTMGASLRAGIPTLIKPWFGYVLRRAVLRLRVEEYSVNLMCRDTGTSTSGHQESNASVLECASPVSTLRYLLPCSLKPPPAGSRFTQISNA